MLLQMSCQNFGRDRTDSFPRRMSITDLDNAVANDYRWCKFVKYCD
jgi:hypothetical protein